MDASSEAGQQVLYQVPNYFANLQSMRVSGELCDVTLNVNGNNFEAHRIILAATIPYFRGMFLSGMKENETNIIELKEIDPLALKLFIDFAYTGEITITESNVDIILTGATYFSLDGLRDACIQFFKTIIKVENVFRLKELAEMLHLTELEVDVNEFFQKKFNKICKTEQFLNFSFACIKNLLSKDELNVCSEEDVIDAMIAWIHADDVNRSKYVEELFRLVRLHLVSLEYLTKYIANITIIRNSIPCRDIIDEARDYHLLLRNPSNRFNDVQPRYCNDKTENVFVLDEVALLYDVSKDTWRETKQPPKMRFSFGLTEYRNKVYVIGGVFSYGVPCNVIDIYDPAGEEWISVEAPFNSRSNLGVTTLNDYLYACGGTTEGKQWHFVDIVEEYNPQTGIWHGVQSMRNKRANPQVTTFQGCVYAIGGHSNDGIHDTIERYDRRTDTWTCIAPMNERRICSGAAVLNEKLYVFGNIGNFQEYTAEVYDPRSDKWEYIAPMKRPMTGLFVHAGKVWKHGLCDDTPEIYDPQNDVWSDGKWKPQYSFSSRFCCCIIRID